MKYIIEPLFNFICDSVIFIIGTAWWIFTWGVVCLWNFKIYKPIDYPFYKETGYDYLWELNVVYITPIDFWFKRNRYYDYKHRK